MLTTARWPWIGGSRRVPVLTMIMVGVATATGIVQYAVPAVVPVLDRDPDALAHGQWWRLATPLLVQTLGWYQMLANLAALAGFGLIAEALLGRWRWLVLFAGGTVGGQLAAYAWDEPGGGDSIAICGLVAGVAVAVLAGRGPQTPAAEPPAPVPPLIAHVTIYYLAALTGWGVLGTAGAGLGFLAAAALLHGLRCTFGVWTERLVLAGALACAPILAVRHDLHGAALTSGFATALLVVLPGSLARSRSHALRRPLALTAEKRRSRLAVSLRHGGETEP